MEVTRETIRLALYITGPLVLASYVFGLSRMARTDGSPHSNGGHMDTVVGHWKSVARLSREYLARPICVECSSARRCRPINLASNWGCHAEHTSHCQRWNSVESEVPMVE